MWNFEPNHIEIEGFYNCYIINANLIIYILHLDYVVKNFIFYISKVYTIHQVSITYITLYFGEITLGTMFTPKMLKCVIKSCESKVSKTYMVTLFVFQGH